jgi:alginate O-acetyltransferase complex protein AlgJ
MNERPLSVTSSAILSVFFLVILVLPVAENLLHFAPEMELPENRKRQDYPKLDWTPQGFLTYPARFETAFNDNFGFRSLLVQWQAFAKYYWLKMSPSPQVLLGRQGWLYYKSTINEHRGIQRLPKLKIRAWMQELQAKQAFFDSRGIRYLFVVAPNKETVYPEFLPPGVQQHRKKLWLDDLLEAVPADSHFEIVDLRAPLLAAKQFGRLYHRTDSHWNALGVMVATNAILSHLSSRCPGLQPEKIERTDRVGWGKSGDLARLMGLQSSLKEETLLIFPPDALIRPADLHYQGDVGGVRTPPSAVVAASAESDCSVIVAGDSFCDSLNRFLPAHFRRTLKLRPFVPYPIAFQESLPRLIAAEKPDVFIELLVDRALFSSPEETFPGEKIRH